MTSTDFSTLGLRPGLLDNLADLGYATMTPVQAAALPDVIGGADVLARANTGSGKTAAFGLGILNALDADDFTIQSLVLCPTRELADQVAKELRRLARAIPNIKIMSVCGGEPLRKQVKSLQRNSHIIVGTPGRVHKHLRDGNIDLAGLKLLVLDEADRMLDMGFEDELKAILAFVPQERQTLLFSATYPDEIAAISASVQRSPKIIDVTEDEQSVQVQQTWCEVSWENRPAELLRALRAWGGALNLVFCNTKAECAEIARHLQQENVAAIALHGDLDQARRTQALVRFASRTTSVLVATDVAARGIDVKDVDAVFNYELPPQAEVYIHRIGRTARAGKTGIAVSLVASRELPRLMNIEKALSGATLEQREIPPNGSNMLQPEFTSIEINGGRKSKLRPGDLLGALTAGGKVPGKQVGSIDLFDNHSYVAVRSDYARAAAQALNEGKIKGRKYRARLQR